MRKILTLLSAAVLIASCAGSETVREANYAKAPRFQALIYYTDHAEEDHVVFAHQAIDYFFKLTEGDGFRFDTTSTLATYTAEQLAAYNALIMVDDMPHSPAERQLFEDYMEHGGGWMGIHVAAYNDKDTHWPWFLSFLGGGVFKCNCWPPQPALAVVDKPRHPVTKNLPHEFVLPASEFYQWDPEPRKNKDIEVLLSLSPKNYPIGLKDVVYGGDWPVVWTNKNYRMIYLNMGHGDELFTEATQKLLYINALRWIISRDPAGNPFDK